MKISNKCTGHMCVILIVSALFSSQAGYAADLDLLEDEFLSDVAIPVVLTGSRLAQPRSEVPGTQTILTRKMIQASGVREIPSLFRLVPGFQVAHDKGIVSVTYHGNSDEYARRLQVLVDGRSVYSPLFGGVDWDDLPLSIDDIQRIEVIRGPNGVAYGANSFIGVINIVTIHPDLAQGNKVKVEAGERGTRRIYYRHGGKTKDLSYRLSVEALEDDYFKGFADEIRRQKINFKSEYRPGAGNTFEFNIGYMDGDNTKGSGVATDPFRKDNVTSSYQQLIWTHQVSNDEEVKLNISHNYHRVDDVWDVVFDFTALAPGLLVPYQFSLSGFDERFNLEYQHTKRLSEELRAVWGAEARLDKVSGINDFGYFNTSATIKNSLYRVFGNVEWAANKDFYMNTGLMVEDNDITGTNYSPRLAVNYHLKPNHTIRSSVSRAYRTPSAFEDRANGTIDLTGILPPPLDINILFLGNQNLKPEQITAYEMGYLLEIPKQRSSLDVKLFYEKIKDIISSVEDKSATDADGEIDPSYMTAGETRTVGIEFQLNYKPSKKDQIWLAYSYARLNGQYIFNRDVSGTNLYRDLAESVPRHTLSLLLSHDFDQGLAVSAGYYNVSSMRLIGGDQTGGYNTVDFRISKTIKAGSLKGRYEFIVRDATGSYFDYDNKYINKPRVLVAVELDF